MTEVENKPLATARKVNEFWYTTSQTIIQSIIEVQNRSLTCTQNILTDGMETLKSHLDASQQLLQTANKQHDQQEALPSLIESGVEASKRNISFLQRSIEQGTETFRCNTDIIKDLMQKIIQQAQEQQKTLWPAPSL